MRSVLRLLYKAGLVAAAGFLALIGVVIVVQIVGRLAGVVVPSADEVAGFSMAASIFLGLAATLRVGGHVRVDLVMSRTPPRLRRALGLWSYVFTMILLANLSWYAFDMVRMSFELEERSPGLLSIPMWIPQSGMALGLVLMTIACAEGTVDILCGRNEQPDPHFEMKGD